MQIPKKLLEKYAQSQPKSKYLHSKNHVLADELSQKFAEPKRFGFYLRLATKYNHEFLRQIAGRVLESNPKKPGALFAFLIKKESTALKEKSNEITNSQISK